ncbi:MAG: hypothetical protein KF694_21420 [Mesorhizobium sp.]|nr:hypothetical protein [Mesorhizobium sp.]
MKAAQHDVPDRSRLKHIVVMLLSMALLAEYAASRRHSVRLLFFRLLGHAEIVALGLFDGPAAGFHVVPDEPRHVRPEDLTALAARLRTIAILIARVFLSGGETGTGKGASPRPAPPVSCEPVCARPAAAYHDTS